MQNSINVIHAKFLGASETIRKIIPYGLPIKLVFSSVLGILGGAGLLGILSDYATYYYAFDMRFRMPFESVPYLKATIAFTSIFLLLTGALVFSSSIILMESIRKLLISIPYIPQITYKLMVNAGLTPDFIKLRLPKFYNRIQSQPTLLKIIKYLQDKDLSRLEKTKNDFAKFQNRSTFNKFSLCIFTGFFMLTIATVLIQLNKTVVGDDEKTLKIIAFAYGFTAGLFMNFHKARWPISFIFTFLYFSFCIFNIFQPLEYAKFLRISGYGGGAVVHLQSKDSLLQEKLSSSTISLILRTNNAYIIYQKKESRILEIPIDEILLMSYPSGNSFNFNYYLPK